MEKEQIKKEWERIYKEYEESNKKYDEYVQQFLTICWNGQITQEAKKSLDKESLEEIIRLRNIRDEKAKEFWDFACSVVFPNSSVEK